MSPESPVPDLKLLLQQAVVHHQSRRFQEAEGLYRAILQAEPRHAEAHHGLGWLAVGAGKPELGLPHLKVALEVNPGNGQYWLSCVEALLAAGNVADAQTLLAQARQKGLAGPGVDALLDRVGKLGGPIGLTGDATRNSAKAATNREQRRASKIQGGKPQVAPLSAATPASTLLVQAIRLHQAGHFDEALVVFQRAVSQEPENAEVQLNFANLLLDQGKPDAGIAALERAIRIRPDFTEAHNNLGSALSDQGRFDAAVASCNAALILNPEFVEAHVNLGNALTGLRDLERAVASYQRALSLRPGYLMALVRLGNALRDLGRLDEAVATYRRVLETNPDFAEVHNNLGNALRDQGKAAAAIICFQDAIRLKPSYAEAYLNLGDTLRECGRPQEAVGSLLRALELKPDLVDAHLALGNTFHDLGRLDEAGTNYKRAIELKPGQAELQCKLGNVLREQGRSESALACYERAVAIKPDFYSAHFSMGAVFLEQGKLEAAVASYRRTIDASPRLAEAHNNIGMVFREQGRPDEALDCFRRALAIEPGLAEAHFNIWTTLLEQGRQDEMLSFARRVISDLPSPETACAGPEAQAITAFMPYGRSGSLFFHALVDSHPQISTLPGVYFKGWFGLEAWKKFRPADNDVDWRKNLVDLIVLEFEAQFDARSTRNVPGTPMGATPHLAKDSGFLEMGPEGNIPFRLDRVAFSRALLDSLQPLATVTQKDCFLLIHRAFDVAAGRGADARTVFYHIHNPDTLELANFIRQCPEARLLYIVRNPVQGLESWMLSDNLRKMPETGGNADDRGAVAHRFLVAWMDAVQKIRIMLQELQSPFHMLAECRGVRLEDVKRNPHATMPAVAAWMGVADDPALYDASFCGLRYWGPSSAVTGKISGFDTRAIDRPLGMLFGERDQAILATLFWPFSRLYGYTEMDETSFRERLDAMRPWLDEPLEFEQLLYSRLPEPRPELKTLAPYAMAHRTLIDYWELLTRDGSYHFMVEPLKLDRPCGVASR
jgi:tetratricopeptide (TPR) repeat protein